MEVCHVWQVTRVIGNTELESAQMVPSPHHLSSALGSQSFGMRETVPWQGVGGGGEFLDTLFTISY